MRQGSRKQKSVFGMVVAAIFVVIAAPGCVMIGNSDPDHRYHRCVNCGKPCDEKVEGSRRAD